eukprot:5795008-Pyramimonas_sp.AAC.1
MRSSMWRASSSSLASCPSPATGGGGSASMPPGTAASGRGAGGANGVSESSKLSHWAARPLSSGNVEALSEPGDADLALPVWPKW